MVILNLLLSVVLGILPALIWLVFFLKAEMHPEPKRLVFLTFLTGFFITLPTLFVQTVLRDSIKYYWPAYNIFILFFILAFVEELFKFLGAYWTVRKQPSFKEPIEAMFYMISIALGFATIENIFIIAGNFNFANPEILYQTFGTLSLRFVGATFLHALSSAIVGYYWAKGHIHKVVFHTLIIGLILATAVHAIFNYLVLTFQNSYLIYPTLFLLTISFFVVNDFSKLRPLNNSEF